jgi:SPP1 family predicted phage head-tail adaptor
MLFVISAAGIRLKKITIETPSIIEDESGELGSTWTTVCEVFASVLPMSGTERWLAQAQQDLTTHKITIPYRSDITTKMRAVYRTRLFNFTSVVNVNEDNRELEIMAIEAK